MNPPCGVCVQDRVMNRFSLNLEHVLPVSQYTRKDFFEQYDQNVGVTNTVNVPKLASV